MTNYVFLCDSPELDTGFANVGRNLLSRIEIPKNSKLYVWGIGHDNIPTDIGYPIYSAGINSSWRNENNVVRFFSFINRLEGNEVILITIQDSFRLLDFCPAIDELRKTKNLQIISYIPVDSYLTLEDEPFISRIDKPVAYTEFGKKEIEKYTTRFVDVIPHGIEHEYYSPKNVSREILFPALLPTDKLIVNVNSNSKRKAPEKSFEILKELLDYNDDYYLYMHMSPISQDYNIKEVAEQLGVVKNVIFADPFFTENIIGKTSCSKDSLCDIYNCADLYLTTSNGEGWGLTAFEAAACGTPIAVPNHTTYKEIFSENDSLLLPLNNTVFFDKKIWPSVDVINSARTIHEGFLNRKVMKEKAEAAKKMVDKYNWDKIISQWNKLIEI
jgi:glycosyltransferase involved in cell wall biosynthesis